MRDGQVISDMKKHVAVNQAENQGVQIMDDKIIHIRPGYELTIQDMNMIHEYLANNKENDTFISLDAKTNETLKQVAQIDEFGNQHSFKETDDSAFTLPKYDGNSLQLIKSKLPLKNALKMAAGSLKKKPFRLITTIALS